MLITNYEEREKVQSRQLQLFSCKSYNYSISFYFKFNKIMALTTFFLVEGVQ